MTTADINEYQRTGNNARSAWKAQYREGRLAQRIAEENRHFQRLTLTGWGRKELLEITKSQWERNPARKVLEERGLKVLLGPVVGGAYVPGHSTVIMGVSPNSMGVALSDELASITFLHEVGHFQQDISKQKFSDWRRIPHHGLFSLDSEKDAWDRAFKLHEELIGPVSRRQQLWRKQGLDSYETVASEGEAANSPRRSSQRAFKRYLEERDISEEGGWSSPKKSLWSKLRGSKGESSLLVQGVMRSDSSVGRPTIGKLSTRKKYREVGRKRRAKPKRPSILQEIDGSGPPTASALDIYHYTGEWAHSLKEGEEFTLRASKTMLASGQRVGSFWGDEPMIHYALGEGRSSELWGAGNSGKKLTLIKMKGPFPVWENSQEELEMAFGKDVRLRVIRAKQVVRTLGGKGPSWLHAQHLVNEIEVEIVPTSLRGFRRPRPLPQLVYEINATETAKVLPRLRKKVVNRAANTVARRTRSRSAGMTRYIIKAGLMRGRKMGGLRI